MQNICDVTSQQWFAYFQKNAKNLLRIPWNTSYLLSEQEKARVISSIQQFELGENSEGKTFRRKALVYAERHDPAYMDALDLFIKEEQRHSATLRRFLEDAKEPTLTKHWVDGVFRKLRKMMDIEVEVIVLLTAETIAMVYYRRLKDATRSPVLQTICEQILLDEAQHINFQSSSLFKIRNAHSWVRKQIMPFTHAFLLLGTSVLVWWQHHSVLSFGQYTLPRFVYEVFLVFHKSHVVSTGRA
jgi:hypothetical protein